MASAARRHRLGVARRPGRVERRDQRGPHGVDIARAPGPRRLPWPEFLRRSFRHRTDRPGRWLRAEQLHRLAVPSHRARSQSPVQYTEISANGAVGHVGPEQLAAVPRLAVLVPLLLHLQHEAGRGRVEAGARHPARAGWPALRPATMSLDALACSRHCGIVKSQNASAVNRPSAAFPSRGTRSTWRPARGRSASLVTSHASSARWLPHPLRRDVAPAQCDAGCCAGCGPGGTMGEAGRGQRCALYCGFCLLSARCRG